MNLIGKIFDICDNYIFQIQKFCSIIFVEHSDSSFLVIGGTFMIKVFFAMLNLLFMTLGSGSSPDPNIYYRTFFLLESSEYGRIGLKQWENVP